MLTDAELQLYQKGVEQGMQHCSTAPETDKRLALQEQRFSSMDETLRDIKKSIDSTKKVMILFLLGLIGSTLYFGFTVGTWRGGIEERLEQVEMSLQRHIDAQR